MSLMYRAKHTIKRIMDLFSRALPTFFLFSKQIDTLLEIRRLPFTTRGGKKRHLPISRLLILTHNTELQWLSKPSLSFTCLLLLLQEKCPAQGEICQHTNGSVYAFLQQCIMHIPNRILYHDFGHLWMAYCNWKRLALKSTEM